MNELAALESALEVYGGDVQRWPVAVARRFKPLLDSDERARQLWREARAFDRLLDTAGSDDRTEAGALAAAIVSAARREPRVPAGVGVGALESARFERRLRRTALPAAVLAASLALGIFAGPRIESVQTAVDFVIRNASAGEQMALGENDTAIEEGLL